MSAARDETPAVARQRVRRALRKARQATPLIQGDVAKRLGWSLSKVQRIESGEVAVSVTDLRALLAVYGVRDEAAIEQLARDAAIARRQRWWITPEYRKHLTPGLRMLLQFEAQATTVRAYQPLVIPGDLQTPAMAEHLLSWSDTSLTDVDRKVRFDVRMLRAKRVAERDDSPAYLLMLDEAVIKRETGGREVMAEQLESVAEIIARRPNIHIRLVKLAMGANLSMMGPFTILDLSDDDHEDAVVYRESYTDDTVDHDSETVGYYRQRFESMWPQCYDEIDSLRLIRAEAGTLRASLIRDS
ncbi:helix-turn-helix transcriptional regulator [Actinoplanes sp. NPDC049118]|uniref:helix-turn-helix domain-containing protein n=1 Tax=Actinoplanes sp. NPDC049118 TaxID=3155769 RepID=UPI00340CCD80